MNERCPDHGEEEDPWMCDCTRARLAALEREIDRTYKAWCGRDLMHLPLCEAVGKRIEALTANAEAHASATKEPIA
jgi:hypothetical protein